MLSELNVSQFAIIENLHIQFKEGLNILSGETGAGKSVLLKSLALLMGAKASSDMIRTGFSQAIIEGCFDISDRKDIQSRLNEIGINTDDKILIVKRVIGSGDKSKVYLNGSINTLAILRDIVAPMIEVTGHGAPLIEMTGQHENKNLMTKSYHLDLLDQYVGCWELRLQYENKFVQLKDLRLKIQELISKTQSREQRLDFLIFQRDEIANLDMGAGEEIELESQVKLLRNISKITHFIDSTESALYSDEGSVVQRLQSVLQRSQEFSQLDPQLVEKIEPLKQAKTLIEESMYDLRNYIRNAETNPEELEKLESKLSDFRKIQKKYGPSMGDILQALVNMESEINSLQNFDSQLETLKKQEQTAQKELFALAEKMHEKRKKGAVVLSESVNAELEDLNMKGVTFHVSVELLNGGNNGPLLFSTGMSDVEFLSQTSPKDPKRGLIKSASGGELSRILLSLKRVVGASDYPRTYLFDEVDSGVSGTTAEKVGKKLKSIAKGQQVICVTHLPQVAAAGDHHFYISKSSKDQGVSMEVTELKSKERVQEIARLISGEKISKTSIAHAQELLKH
jgi:DNA repair protein RecN (Recombination protein N)